MKSRIAIVLLLSVTACQAPKKPDKEAPAPAEPTITSTPTTESATVPPQPALSAAEAKRQAQVLALQAAALLDEGKTDQARDALRAARELDERNEVAAKLAFSMDADPEKELGTKFFRLTIKHGDTLSKIAEQYLGEQYKFFLLARYNAIAVPRDLKADQVIKVPGTRPAPPTKDESAKAEKQIVEPKPPAKASATDLLQECKREWAVGNKERALEKCEAAAATTPKDPEAGTTLERYRKEMAQSDERKAREAYRKQDLDGCITLWNKVLQRDPAHDSAARERDRCMRLKAELEKSAK